MSGDINLNLGPTTPKRNHILWELLPFHNCRWIISLILYLKLAMTHETYFKRGMHFIHLNKNSLLSKRNEIRYIAQLTNATVIGSTKLDNTVLSSELEIEGYDLARSDRSRRGGDVACFVKNCILYNRKPNFCINTETIFIEICLPKSKPVLIGTL